MKMAPIAHICLCEKGLSWHRQSAKVNFLLRCNNLTGIDEMRYVWESFSILVRPDHDENTLSYECLSVVARDSFSFSSCGLDVALALAKGAGLDSPAL